MTKATENGAIVRSGASGAGDDRDNILEQQAALEARIHAILPATYQYCDAVSPTSMGSAPLKFTSDGRVAWDQIWTHFCDLALAGGPPHRGTLLEVPTPEEVASEPAGYQLVYEEIRRGIRMTTGLASSAAEEPGWVDVVCSSEAMAQWMLRAVMAENVFVRRREHMLQLPAGPRFRWAKEVKNVVVALAKTCHYWEGHLSDSQRRDAVRAFADGPQLLEPASRAEVLARAADYHDEKQRMEHAIAQDCGLSVVPDTAAGWLGIRLPDERSAAWFVRSAIADNMLVRREAEIFILPVAVGAAARLSRLHRLWASQRDAEVRRR